MATLYFVDCVPVFLFYLSPSIFLEFPPTAPPLIASDFSVGNKVSIPFLRLGPLCCPLSACYVVVMKGFGKV